MNLLKFLHRPAPVNSKPEIVKEGQPMAQEQKRTIDLLVKYTGKAFREIPADIAELLLTAFPDRFEILLPKAPPAPLVRTFGLKDLLSGLVALQWNKGAEVGYYDGAPELVGKYFPDCPQVVIDEYARRYMPRANRYSSEGDAQFTGALGRLQE